MKTMQTIKSYLVSLQASRCVGKSERLEKNGKHEEAFKIAREGLSLLSHPVVIRNNPAESATLIVLTMQLERLAHEHHYEGASENELVYAYHMINQIYPDDSKGNQYREWLPYIEARLGYSPKL